MAETSDIMRSEKYIRLYTKIATSDVQKGIVYIEDALDRIFWERVFDYICPNRYIVKPYSQPGSEGKRKLELEYKNLHRNLLVAIDADYDYLCPQRNDYAEALHSNPYIIHTYFYSKESYIHTSDSIDILTNNVYLNVKTTHQINNALKLYSNIIYDAFCYFSWLHNIDANQFPESEFNPCIEIPSGIKILNEDLTVNGHALDLVRESSVNYIDRHIQYIENKDDFNHHIERLRELGLHQDNTLLFTNGHSLLDIIFRPSYQMFIKKCKKNDNEWVTKNYPEGQHRARLNQVRNHYEQNCKETTLIHHCQGYTNNEFWKKIVNKIERLANSDN